MNITDVTRATRERAMEIWETLRTHGSISMDTVHYRKDGSQFPVHISSTYTQHGGKEYFSGFAFDLIAFHPELICLLGRRPPRPSPG
jgi:hypothetical protein